MPRKMEWRRHWLQVSTGLSDTFNWRYSTLTFFILTAIAYLTMGVLHGGEWLICKSPNHFSGADSNFAIKTCRRTPTLFPLDDVAGIPTPQPSYNHVYDLIYLVLIIQGVLFIVPEMILDGLCRRLVGLNFSNFAHNAYLSTEQLDPQEHEATFSHLANTIREYLDQSVVRRRISYCFWFFHGNILTLSYLLVKILCLINIIVQYFLVGYILDLKFARYGFDKLQQWVPSYVTISTSSYLSQGANNTLVVNISRIAELIRSLTGGDIPDHINLSSLTIGDQVRFIAAPDPNQKPFALPRSGLFDFKLRILGNIQRYTVQCNYNYPNLVESFLLIDWFWMLIVAIVTFLSLIVLLGNTLVPLSCRLGGASSMELQCEEGTDPPPTEWRRQFTQNYLRRDGLLLLDVVAKAAGKGAAERVRRHLWEEFLTKRDDYSLLITPVTWSEDFFEFYRGEREAANQDQGMEAGTCRDPPPAYELQLHEGSKGLDV